MKFAVKTVRFAAFPVLLLAPAPAAELNSSFLETKWANRQIKSYINQSPDSTGR